MMYLAIFWGCLWALQFGITLWSQSETRYAHKMWREALDKWGEANDWNKRLRREVERLHARSER